MHTSNRKELIVSYLASKVFRIDSDIELSKIKRCIHMQFDIFSSSSRFTNWGMLDFLANYFSFSHCRIRPCHIVYCLRRLFFCKSHQSFIPPLLVLTQASTIVVRLPADTREGMLNKSGWLISSQNDNSWERKETHEIEIILYTECAYFHSIVTITIGK